MTVVQVRTFLGSRHATPRLDLEFRAGAPDLTAVVSEAVSVGPDAVLLVSSAHDAARLVRQLRPRFVGPIFGSGRLGLARLRREAGPTAEGIVLPLLHEPWEDWKRFAREFRDRFGREPDYLAGQTYDAVRVLVQAIRKAGLNRSRILDALQALGPWPGVSGVIEWDPQGRNMRPVGMARVESGQLAVLAR
jgi:branched-chain amino acid transport system substrate-binding protein